MKFLKNIFRKREEPVRSYEEFWRWFAVNEKLFFDVVSKQGNIEQDFFNKLSPKLQELRDGFFYLTGMYNDDIAELILTADGNIKNIAFVEDLVNAAPALDRWKFTALKPPSDITNVDIEMAGYRFNSDNLRFFSNTDKNFPDEINITVVHEDYTEENKSTIINGGYIFLDNFLGELNSVTTIDSVQFADPKDVNEDLIPIDKLKAYLGWRQKEFTEKYEGVRHETEENSYSIMEAELPSGNMLIAVINTDLLGWDRKASHPWIVSMEIKFGGLESGGMPDDETFKRLEEIETKVTDQLKVSDGYLNIGRQTADGVREIYFACKEFRKPSKVLHRISEDHVDIMEITFEIYIDKYWRSFDRFNSTV